MSDSDAWTHCLPSAADILNKHNVLTLMGGLCRSKLNANVVKSSALNAVALAVRHKLTQAIHGVRQIAMHRTARVSD